MIMFVWIAPGSARQTNGLRQDHGPLMRTRIINQRPSFLPNVFQGDPDATHEMGRARTEMHQVGMNVLLRADGEIQSLKSEGSPAVEFTKQVDHHRVRGDAADTFVFFPS